MAAHQDPDDLLTALRSHTGTREQLAAAEHVAKERRDLAMAKLVLLLERVKDDPLKGAALAGVLDGIFDQLLSGVNPVLASHLDSVIAGNEALSENPSAVDAWAAALASAEQPGGWTIVVGRDGKIVGFNKLGPDGRPVRPESSPRGQSGSQGGAAGQQPIAPPTPQPSPTGTESGRRQPAPAPSAGSPDAATTAQTPATQQPGTHPRRRWGG